MFTGLLPDDVVTACGDPREPSPALSPAEEQLVVRAVAKRRAEFRRGRACAHSVLERLGVPNFSLLAGAQREPLWPPGIVGSITHTDGLCAVAAARDSAYRGIGIDVEPNLPLEPNLVDYVCGDAELRHAAVVAERERAARLIFSAKEAVYKCQFYLSRRFLEFHDVNVRLSPTGEFAAELLVDVPEVGSGACIVGRFAQRGGYLLTASWIRR